MVDSRNDIQAAAGKLLLLPVHVNEQLCTCSTNTRVMRGIPDGDGAGAATLSYKGGEDDQEDEMGRGAGGQGRDAHLGGGCRRDLGVGEPRFERGRMNEVVRVGKPLVLQRVREGAA